MIEWSRILTILTSQLTNNIYSITHEVVFEAEAVVMAEAKDEDEAIKAASLIRITARTSRNAYQKKNISIAKIITSVLIMAVLAILEVIIAHLITLNVTFCRTRTTRRKLSRLEAIRTTRIKARNDLTLERTLYALTTMRTTTMTSIPPMITTISPRNAPPSA